MHRAATIAGRRTKCGNSTVRTTIMARWATEALESHVVFQRRMPKKALPAVLARPRATVSVRLKPSDEVSARKVTDGGAIRIDAAQPASPRTEELDIDQVSLQYFARIHRAALMLTGNP